MVYNLPARGEPDWDAKLNDSFEALKADVDAAVADATVARSTAIAASNKADSFSASTDAQTAQNVQTGPQTQAALLAEYVDRERFRSVTDPDLAIPLATVVDGVSVTSASTTLTGTPGSFSADMDGQHFYLEKGGPVLVGGTYAWEASPIVGTITYVSSSQVTLSVAASSTVTGGRVLIGDDATSAWQAALGLCKFMRIPAGVHLLLAGYIVQGSGQVIVGDGSATCSVRSVTNSETPWIAARGAVKPVVKGVSIWGTARGSQPANVTPSGTTTPDLSTSGCGLVFVNAQGGIIEDVIAYHCGGDMVTSGRNGIAGIYLTMGCRGVVVTNSKAFYCRNGINEDSYFDPSGLDAYAARDNTFNDVQTDYNVFGLAFDSGSLSRGSVANGPRASYNVQTGISAIATKKLIINSPRTAFNGVSFTNAGIQIYGSSSTVIAEDVTINNPISFGNGTHGIKVSDWAYNVRIFGGLCDRNFRNGIYFNNNADNGLVYGTSVRDNGQGLEVGGERDGVRITSSTGVRVMVNAYDDQGSPSQLYGVREVGTANDTVIMDGSIFGTHATGPYLLIGSRSRRGAFDPKKPVRAAQGLKGEAFGRAEARASFAPAAGDQRATLTGFQKGEVVTNVHFQITVAGSSVTLFKVGIWDSGGTLLASSADFSASVGSTGAKTVALSSTWTVPSDGAYYVGLVTVGGTAPTLLCGTTGITGYSGQAISGGVPPSVGNTGKTDIGTMTITASGNAPWVAWS